MPQVPRSTSFHRRLITVNALDEVGLGEWLFHPGMLFGSTVRWWGDMARRDTPHEGLDLQAYRTVRAAIRNLNEVTAVPVIFGGKVVRIIDDFLGRSVFVRHARDTDGSHLYTAYGHVRPFSGTQPGEDMEEGGIIGTIADAREKNAAIPSHLHVSVAWVKDTVPPEVLDWKTMADSDMVVLIDPLSVIECPYTVLQP
jgi:hypothetical protein